MMMMHNIFYIASLLISVIIGTTPTLAISTEDEGEQHVIVTYKTANTISSDDTVMAGALSESTMVSLGEVTAWSYATTINHRLAPQNAIAATYTAAALEVLHRDPNIASIEPDYEVYAIDDDGYEQHEEMLSSVSSGYLRSASNKVDEGRRLQQSIPYGIPLVQADQVNAIRACRKKVCVIDSGYYDQNEDLPNQSSDVTGRTFVDNPWNSNLKSDHGTHVAGTIAAIDNTVGVVGTTNDAWLHIGRVFEDRSGSISAIVNSINDCVNEGAAVINMSLGSSSNSNILRRACNGANGLGVLLVAAAGNSGNSDPIYPAALSDVVSVAAVNQNKNRAGFSTRNDQVELSAPGVGILSTCNGSASYCSKSGTSMASPHVAGVAALIWSHYPDCTNDEIRRALQTTAERLGDVTQVPNSSYGYGLIQARNALTYLENNPCDNGDRCPAVPPMPPPTPKPTTPKPTTPKPTTPKPTTPKPTTPKPTPAPITPSPTSPPTNAPTTNIPTGAPSKSPVTNVPTLNPSKSPVTNTPTGAPTDGPSTSSQPSASSQPSSMPSEGPSLSDQPTSKLVTYAPTNPPTVSSKPSISLEPSKTPSKTPTTTPSTPTPTQSPTLSPSVNPTSSPSTTPPSKSPITPQPSASPSKNPSRSPSKSPITPAPSKSPITPQPSKNPSSSPSKSPTTASPVTPTPTDSPTTASPTDSPVVACSVIANQTLTYNVDCEYDPRLCVVEQTQVSSTVAKLPVLASASTTCGRTLRVESLAGPTKSTDGICSISGDNQAIVYTPSRDNKEVTTQCSYMICTSDGEPRLCAEQLIVKIIVDDLVVELV